MLVLSRKVGEKLVIGDDIVLTVCEVRGGRVRLGICGPPHVAIHRQEVLDRILCEPTGIATSRPCDESSYVAIA
jgi:carbon storage regulator